MRIRLHYLDWTRGLAAVIMLQGHVFHSFTRNELRNSGPYVLSQFVGGLPPAVFLFLAGVTLAFLMDGQERKGLAARERVVGVWRRAGYLFGIALLFRLQLWLFGLPSSSWTDLFRVDILNCMGLAVAVMALMAVFRTEERARLCAVLGLAIAFASPLVSQIDWSGVPAFIKNYTAPDYALFGFFPWASFVAFGVSAGSIIRTASQEQMERVMQWAAVLGLCLIISPKYLSEMPYSLYTKSEFWLDSPWLILMKLGVILLILPFAFLWTQYVATQGWSWLRQFGTTSLLVYWVHIELVYGRWLGAWKQSLDISQTVAAAEGVILLMLGISLLKTHGRHWAAVSQSWWRNGLALRRVS